MKKVFVGIFGVLFAMPVMAAGSTKLGAGSILDQDGNKLKGGSLVCIDKDGKELNDQSQYIANDGTFNAFTVNDKCVEIKIIHAACKDMDVPVGEFSGEYKLNCRQELTPSVVVGDYKVSGDYGCDKEDNEYIVPDLALCSTHAYNIGMTSNPENESDREFMREVVALKTTLMTQQMNKQYEYLESMIRRFKIQLEKAVLLTRLEKAGASTESSSGGGSSASAFKSTDRNVHMDGVENCNTKLLPTDVLQCLSTNLTTISNVTGNGSEVSREARKQMVNDVKVLKGTYSSMECKSLFGSDQKSGKCENENSIKKKAEFQNCIDEMRACIRDKMYKLNLEEQQSRRNN